MTLHPVVQPLLAGFTLTLLLAACSAPESPQAPAGRSPAETQADLAKIKSEMPSPPQAAAPAKRMMALPAIAEVMAYAPQADNSLPGYRDVPREQYQTLTDNPVQLVSEQPVSTFSIDVDTGSYANVRRFLNAGQLPPRDAVRLEELVNYFPYDYPSRADGRPFAVSSELMTTPWNPRTRLLRLAVAAQEQGLAAMPPANLVFLVDVSGSMDRREGLPMVQATLKLLVEQLRAEDRVALVTYAGDARLVLASTPGSDKARIRAAIDQLSAGGGTAGASGIQLAYQQARQSLQKDGINRILLATDGDFNVGISDFASLKAMAERERRSGVSLTTLGFGVDNYNEQLMEQLADAGDGNYAYIDTLQEARKVLVEQLASTLSVVARDVKLQVEFNPAQVSQYRLLGYENRQLKREDFNNDQVDAGEIGAGQRVTALYEIVPAGQKGWIEPLRYQGAESPASNSGELAWLRLRYKTVTGGQSQLIEQPLPAQVAAQPSADLRFAAAVAAIAQQLRGERYTQGFGADATLALARGALADDRFGLRHEFVQLVELAQSLHNPALSTQDAVQ